jgi:hypothetical protein
MTLNNRWSKVGRAKDVYLPSVNEFKILDNNSKICSLGSCFADRIGWELNKRKINIGEVEIIRDKKHVTFPWGSFFNPLNFSQIIQHVLEIKKIDFNPETFIKVPKNLQGNHYESSAQFKEIGKYKLINLHAKIKHDFDDYDLSLKKVNENLTILKNSIKNSDAIIITLGLIETWIDKKSEIAWHAFHGEALKKKSIDDKAYFKKLNYTEVVDCLKNMINILVNDLNKKIIFTVSPIPMAFTFSENDVVVANRYSKSLLRSSIENFIDNKSVFYFPSFEIVVDSIGIEKSFIKDKIHISPNLFENYIGPLFFKNFFN